MMGMMIGAIGAIANAERRRAYYDDVPVVYAPQPYYGPQPYYDGYAPGYYGYEPQPAYPVAPAYTAPVYAPADRAGPASCRKGTPIIVSRSLRKTGKVGSRVNTSSPSLN
jgi:hypothetical protein